MSTRPSVAPSRWLWLMVMVCELFRDAEVQSLGLGRGPARSRSRSAAPVDGGNTQRRRFPPGGPALNLYLPPRRRQRQGNQAEVKGRGGLGTYKEPVRERAWGRDGVLRPSRYGYTEALLPPTATEHHASQLLITYSDDNPQKWRLLCAWFSGVEGMGTVTLMVSHLGRGDSVWSTPRIAAVQPGRSLQNPVWLWDKKSGVVNLMLTSQSGKNQGTAAVCVTNSTDGGLRWNTPMVVFAQPGAFLKNPPIRGLGNDGEWLLPMYYTPKGMGNIPSQWSDMRFSRDGGATWSEGIRMAAQGSGLVQPSIVRLPSNSTGEGEGELLAFFRSRRRDNVWRARSFDEGRSWSQPKRTPLPNPNKAVQALTLQSGAVALVFNNNRGNGVGKTKGHIYRDSKMHPLSVGLSFDGGRTWPYVRDLQQDFDVRLEFSYPSIVQTADGDIHITYTWSHTRRRVAVRYVRVTEDWIKRRYDFGPTRGVYQPPQLQREEGLHETSREGMLNARE